MTLPPILVTGAHRSGSTWVGRMLAAARSAVYIHEPFHINHHPGICGAVFPQWYTFICDENATDYYQDLRKCVNLSYNLKAEIIAGNLPRQWKRILRQYFKFLVYRIVQARVVIKDPIALFSAEWLSATFNMKVVVMIRHPAAFAGSLKKADWSHPFDHFLAQPLLMQNYLSEFSGEIAFFAEEQQPIIDQAALLWKITHAVILRFKERHPDWIFVRHEDISREPINHFKDIFARLSLPWDRRTDRIIRNHSLEGHQVESTASQSMLVRDSKANIQSWKSRLSTEEIEKIKNAAKSLSGSFYSEDEW